MCLGKRAVGIDIADNSIEVAEVTMSFSKSKVRSLGRVVLENGLVEFGRVKNAEKLGLALKEILKTAKPYPIKAKDIVFGLPERQVFLRNFILPPHERKKRDGLILEEILTNIPVAEKDLVFSYRILNENKEGIEILVAGSNKTVVGEWRDFFKKNNLNVKIFDIEMLANFRDLFFTTLENPVGVVDMGTTTSFFGIFDKTGLRYERVINCAGNNFTNAIAKAEDLDVKKAELEKIKFGLNSKSKKVLAALAAEIKYISEEIKNTLAFFKQQNGAEVKEIVLVGGSSQLIGLDKYLEQVLKIPVSVGSARPAGKKAPLEYIEAIGLALRDLDKSWDKKDPEIIN